MKYIRMILTPIILFIDWITRPKSEVKRSEAEQALIDEKAKNLTLYQFQACPFCIKVRRALCRLGVSITLKDARIPTVADELIKGGGKRKVPCLRIQTDDDVQWMYESDDIIAYLKREFDTQK